MAYTNANDLKKGMAIRFKGDICIVLDTQHRTPGNLRAFVQASLRSLNTGRSSDERLGSTDKIELVDVRNEKWDFSYKDQSGWNFMNPETYESMTLTDDLIGSAKDYLTENLQVQLVFVEGRVAEIELPPTVTLSIIESADGVRGDSANNVQKPAKLETGLDVQVPLFIKEGEKVKVDTRTGKYISRA
ncbi:MAG: elongation factor P [Blastochloris sp.]|nr:elongation factor P [Blastochloris sp.]